MPDIRVDMTETVVSVSAPATSAGAPGAVGGSLHIEAEQGREVVLGAEETGKFASPSTLRRLQPRARRQAGFALEGAAEGFR